MIAEIGFFALILALSAAVVQAVFPMIGAARGDRILMDMAKPAAVIQFALVAIAFGALTYCHVVSDFSVLNVAVNSHADEPLLYKVSGVWGNHEGSMLLWELVLTIYGMTVAVFGSKFPTVLRTRALAVQSMISVGHLLFIIFISNPFARLYPVPLNGNGLNPLLQDPGLAFHPPVLYLGYTGFSMVFSFAIAALIAGKVDAVWARLVRLWTLAAWSFLTLGIAGGSWWAYYTLGWGGWWYWDPVENAAFMPWLTGTALLHALIVVEKRDVMKAWTILLSIITFSLALLGTFLVRSGVLISVHSFAADPSRGVFILCILAAVTGGSLILFAIRAHMLKDGGVFSPVSREGGLLFNNVFLAAVTGSVFLGTLYPLFADVLNLGKVSVGAPFFNAVFIPMIIPAVLAIPIGMALAWKRDDLQSVLRRLRIAGIIAVLTMAIVWLLTSEISGRFAGAAYMGLAVWVFAGCLLGLSFRRILKLPRSSYGMIISHIGVALLIVGIVGSSLWRVEKIQIMRLGETVQVAGYDLTLKSVEEGLQGHNYIYSHGVFIVESKGEFVAEIKPEKRLYAQPPMLTTNADIRTTLAGSLYAVITDMDGKGGYITRLYYDPLV
ncbi:MAG: heme lyase CcmF/NrfE family subunit, partial [Alphaproteobacteria bacterium]|nr:heme lyase CcmF/NrfE family subunit [Alphaproteobacteria bacterium]